MRTAAAAGDLPQGSDNPCRARQLPHPQQQAGAGKDEGTRQPHQATFSAAVLSGPQQDREEVEIPACRGHSQPPVQDYETNYTARAELFSVATEPHSSESDR